MQQVAGSAGRGLERPEKQARERLAAMIADSDPAAELAETRAKFRAMLGALIVP